MKIFNTISRLPEFKKDLKRLVKRYKTLEDDLKIFIEKQTNLYHKLGVDNRGIFQITGTEIDNPKIFKATKFACRSLKGKGVRSGIRVIYSYDIDEDALELIEIYHKNDKVNEDMERIKSYCNHFKK
ncbi:MAG: hypothetical protein JRC60_01865 [Deltaproteobacteria bacterium]|nr:hypothetical protein [Deltaproteobacteria bacterium]